MAVKVIWLVWGIWMSSFIYGASHELAKPLLPNVRMQGCVELWQWRQRAWWTMIPMRRSSQFVCLNTVPPLYQQE